MKRFTEDNLKEVINKQMEINWYSERWNDLQNIPDWFNKFTTTEETEKKFKEWLKVYLKPFTIKARIDIDIWWFILNYWLRNIWIKNGKIE